DDNAKRLETATTLNPPEPICKPAKLPPEAAGRDFAYFGTKRGMRVAVLSLLGRTYMNVRADCPFHAADRVLAEVPKDVKVIVVDVHAETTSEKMALGWYLNGRVTAVVGTHTHVPTADARILPAGTAYITDLGMTGPYGSVLGRDKDRVIKALVTGMPHPYDVAWADVHLSGAIVECDSTSGRAIRIERVWERDDSPPGSATDDG